MSSSSHSIKPVLFVLTSHKDLGQGHEDSGFYLPELTHPLHVLEEANIATEFVSIQGGLPPVYGVDLADPINAHYWNDESFQEKLKGCSALSDVNSGDYSAIMYVGGHGTMWDFPQSPAVLSITREMYEQGQVVAAVCHGPAALVNVTLSDGSYLVAGKKVAAFTDSEKHAVGMVDAVPFLLETTLKERGALHQAAEEWTNNVVVDGSLITGQNPQSAAGVGEAIRDALLS
ncbi:type 1 glutamine amidotransferase domain-containing protein [Vibrio fluvialis]|uniref:type 1 glutamine amidotransferase domain-containing protein n=1 Tax=Vibrio fluvialis TaxID=676 RepID=UPI00192C72BC|nr:type 1 glutamine amidotransferase domain-containing protein [Vibrio fluvialis]MBL4285369.1 type 1 glutamine amidotransferase domain-containing protein [Vibrio fluvialis]MBL4289540.1 type 1 glutamine amidotransferase domain-containing protein [Vibrio fluvialis]